MTEPPTFETGLAELEQILRALEDGTTTLEEGLARYERGVALLKVCYGHLRGAESRISQLAGLDADGKPLLRPFDHTASDAASEDKSRKAPRSKPGTGQY
jgi:exodeoxyribonuclease VII small subunit